MGATQRGADYAEALETCRYAYLCGICIWTGSMQIPCNLTSEPYIFGTVSGICSKVVQRKIPYLRKRKIACPTSPPEDAIPDRPMSKLKKQAGRHLPPRVYSSLGRLQKRMGIQDKGPEDCSRTSTSTGSTGNRLQTPAARAPLKCPARAVCGRGLEDLLQLLGRKVGVGSGAECVSPF